MPGRGLGPRPILVNYRRKVESDEEIGRPGATQVRRCPPGFRGLQLTAASREESADVFAFCETVGLPTTLAGLGLDGCDHGRLMLAAESACASGSSIHHEAVEVTPRMVVEAMLAADGIGRERNQDRARQARTDPASGTAGAPT